MSIDFLPALRPERPAWNKGRIIGQKRPLLPKHVWSIRVRLEMADNRRDLALFNMAVDSKLRGCDLVCLKVRDAPVHTARPLLHPNDAARGTRTLPFLGEVLIPREEIGKAPDMIRLKDLFNVRVGVSDEEYILAYAGEDLADARALKAPIIQWLPAELALPAILETQDGPVSGVCEPAAGTLQGKVVQFERVGFARIDHVEPQDLIAYFCHR